MGRGRMYLFMGDAISLLFTGTWLAGSCQELVLLVIKSPAKALAKQPETSPTNTPNTPSAEIFLFNWFQLFKCLLYDGWSST